MKNNIKKQICIILALALIMCNNYITLADNVPIVAIGADLNTEQRESMFQFFNVDKNQVEIIDVTNEDERNYLSGIATDEQIGTHAYSCVYIEPINSGGINVMTANLTWVTGDMIRNALITSGITNCNVIAASPIKVSGTGALTGIFKAYTNGNNKLDSEKMEVASLELITTTTLADEIGQEQASQLVTDLKEEVIENEQSDDSIIADLVDIYLDAHNIKLSKENRQKLIDLLTKISKLDYDVDKIRAIYKNIKSTSEIIEGDINNISDNVKENKTILDNVGNFFKGIGDFFKFIYKTITKDADNKATDETATETDDKTLVEDLYQSPTENLKNVFSGVNLKALGDGIKVTNTDDGIEIKIKKNDDEQETDSNKEVNNVNNNTYNSDINNKSALDNVTFDYQQ